MKFRETTPEDLPAIEDFLKRKGLGYKAPEPSQIIASRTLVDDAGKIMAVVFAVKAVEVSVTLDPSLHPAIALKALREMHGLLPILKSEGYSEVTCFVPPGIEAPYGRRLLQFGWLKAWAAFCLRF